MQTALAVYPRSHVSQRLAKYYTEMEMRGARWAHMHSSILFQNTSDTTKQRHVPSLLASSSAGGQ